MGDGQNWTALATAALVLLAVLVGAALPVLFQLFGTLRATRRLIDQLGPKIDRTLNEVQKTSQRINRASAGLETSVARVRETVHSVGQIGGALRQARSPVRLVSTLGAAVGPALAAATRAYLDARAASRGATRDRRRREPKNTKPKDPDNVAEPVASDPHT